MQDTVFFSIAKKNLKIKLLFFLGSSLEVCKYEYLFMFFGLF